MQPESAATRILVVDDEAPLVELVRGYLAREGWSVSTAADGPSALEVIRNDRPDVVVLDLMLPGIDGIEVCRQLRTFSDAYVLMLTAKSEEVDKLVGLAVGADDYLTKPFSPRELVARVRAMLRRAHRPSAGSPGLEVDTGRRLTRVDGHPIDLTRTEFDILASLARQPGVVLDRPTLLASVWGPGYTDDHLIDVHIANLRRKLGDSSDRPRFVETVRGVGYRLVTT
ncbi:MAG TPA: response regulator transcription factor [Candidatus Limnocylindrales bacterium]|nr:response regulator transcription factor [Candidatus Limnocylindrales bacterium]